MIKTTILAGGLVVLMLQCFGATIMSQTSIPPDPTFHLKDTSSLKPPPGASVAVIEYEDLECPYCAYAFPIVHKAVKSVGVPLVELDYQIPSHTWSHNAAITAHYLRANYPPSVEESYRRTVFSFQEGIATQDDLKRVTVEFSQKYHLRLPGNIDPQKRFSREVDSSTAQGKSVGIKLTPSIFIVTRRQWIYVDDVSQLESALEAVVADMSR